VISGGERQLVAIARALMIKPEILLLDEAFSAIDPDQRRRVLRAFLAVQREFRITTLAVTHNFDEALYLGSQIGILMQGKLIQVGNPQDVFQHPAAPEVARFLGAENLFYGRFERLDPAAPSEVAGISPAIFTSGTGVELRVLAENEGAGYALVRPEDITLSVEKPKPSSALNQLEGTIERILDKGVLVQIRIDAGMPFEVSITPQSQKGLGLEEGSRVFMSFKATAIKTY
jgi:molybdopterin-binding protein